MATIRVLCYESTLGEAQGGLKLMKKLASSYCYGQDQGVVYQDHRIPYLFGSNEHIAKPLIWNSDLIWSIVFHLEVPFTYSWLSLKEAILDLIFDSRGETRTLPGDEYGKIRLQFWTPSR